MNVREKLGTPTVKDCGRRTTPLSRPGSSGFAQSAEWRMYASNLKNEIKALGNVLSDQMPQPIRFFAIRSFKL